MPLRPVDEDALAAACRSIARDSYGFVYVDRDEAAIKSEYESQDKSMIHVDSLTTAQIKDTLRDVASSDNYPFQQLRSGVFYMPPFGTGFEMGIAAELQRLFRSQIVVTVEELRNYFDLAFDDADFFASELADRNLVMRIVAGNRDYYTVGTKLKDHVEGEGEDLDDKLVHRSMNGKISHEQLEEAIAVSAVSDVIDYLGTEGYVIDLDGEYLVPAAIDEFTRWLAAEIQDDVVAAFETAGYVMPAGEYESLVTEQIEARSNVLASVRSSRGDVSERDIVSGVTDRFASEEEPQITTDEGLAVQTEPATEEIETHAQELVRPVLNDTTAATPSSMLEDVKPEIEQLRLAQTEAANDYLQGRITDRAEELIREDFA